MQELSNLCRATALDAVYTFEDFFPRKFSAALNHLKPGKAPGPDSICSELLIHAGPGYVASSLLVPTQNSKSLEKGAGSCNPYALKTCQEPTELQSHRSALHPLQDP